MAERVRAAIQLRTHEAPAIPLSVSEICRLAGVNRSNLYANHRDLVLEIQRARESAPRRESTPKRNVSVGKDAAEVRKLEEVNRALLYVALELQLEVRALRAKLKR